METDSIMPEGYGRAMTTMKCPLFMTDKRYFKKVTERRFFRGERWIFRRVHYELSKDAPRAFRYNYLKYCRETKQRPRFY